jgi:UPF0271 protein
MGMKLDLNCDLGEGEPVARTRALMRCITSANIACGGHAGDLRSIAGCIRLAQQSGVNVGAHPGPPGRRDFGRGPLEVSGDELELWLLQQAGVVERLARDAGTRLHHIKLHGALYHATELSEGLARRYLTAARRWWPRAILFVRSGGIVARLARRAGVRAWEEVFADRAYRDDGSLVPRGEPGAMLAGLTDVSRRLEGLRDGGGIETVSGRRLRPRARTLCVHSDTPGAVKIARLAAATLRG